MAELDPEQTNPGAGLAADRLRDVEAVSGAALAHLSLDDLLDELLERVQAILEVDTVAVLLLDRDAGEVVARAARGLEEEVRQGSRIPLGHGFAGRIAADMRPIVIRDIEEADVVNPILRERGVRSLLGVPLIVEGASIGVMHVGSLTLREFGDTDAVLLQLVADRVAVAIDRARLLEAERQAREEAEAAAARLLRLESLTEAALSQLPLEELLDELLTRLRDLLESQTATVLLLDEEADELVAYAAKGVEEEARRRVRIPMGQGFAGTVAAQASPVVIPDVGPGKVLNPILLDAGIRSLLGVPLLVKGNVIGVLHVGTLAPRDFGPDDISLLQLAADRIALAIERARLFEAERHAREAAERSADLIGRVQSITEVALAHLALDDELLNEMLARVRDGLEVDTAAILTLDREANELVARAARGLEEEVERGVRIPVGGGFAGRIAASGEPVVLNEVRHSDVLNPILRLRGIRSLLGVPLLVEGRVIGVLHVGSLTQRTFTEENVTLLQMAADRIAVALDRARLSEREHLVAVTLQRSLLPDHLPRVEGLQLAARYRPGEGETEVGGDWYDAIILPNGNVGIAIGDVVTRGLRAASVTAQLRNALRAYALEGHPPGQLMSRLARLTRTLPGREMATLLYMEVEPGSGTVLASTAGHPP
ncbi:MAG: GAF domain-containing protein, partial [Gaiellaceae bacterium]